MQLEEDNVYKNGFRLEVARKVNSGVYGEQTVGKRSFPRYYPSLIIMEEIEFLVWGAVTSVIHQIKGTS